MWLSANIMYPVVTAAALGAAAAAGPTAQPPPLPSPRPALLTKLELRRRKIAALRPAKLDYVQQHPHTAGLNEGCLQLRLEAHLAAGGSVR